MRNGVMRFSLRAGLMLVAAIAALAFVGSAIQRHRVVVERYERAAVSYEVNRITTAEFLDAVDRLHASERKLPWLSRGEITRRQRERLEELLVRQRARHQLAMTSDEGEVIMREAIQRIEQMLLELEPPSDVSDREAFTSNAD